MRRARAPAIAPLDARRRGPRRAWRPRGEGDPSGFASAASSRSHHAGRLAPTSATSVWASRPTSSPIFAERAGRDGERPPSSATAYDSCARARSAREDELVASSRAPESLGAKGRQRSRRASQLRGQAAFRSSRSRRPASRSATSQPAAFSPNVVGTACWRSVRERPSGRRALSSRRRGAGCGDPSSSA